MELEETWKGYQLPMSAFRSSKTTQEKWKIIMFIKVILGAVCPRQKLIWSVNTTLKYIYIFDIYICVCVCAHVYMHMYVYLLLCDFFKASSHLWASLRNPIADRILPPLAVYRQSHWTLGVMWLASSLGQSYESLLGVRRQSHSLHSWAVFSTLHFSLIHPKAKTIHLSDQTMVMRCVHTSGCCVSSATSRASASVLNADTKLSFSPFPHFTKRKMIGSCQGRTLCCC